MLPHPVVEYLFLNNCPKTQSLVLDCEVHVPSVQFLQGILLAPAINRGSQYIHSWPN